MIAKLQKVYLNSFYSLQNGNSYRFELNIPDDVLSTFNYISIAGIQIDNFYQFTNDDSMILNEGGIEEEIVWPNTNYMYIKDFTDDIAAKLTQASVNIGNNFTYTVTFNTIDQSITISCSNIVILKSLQFVNNRHTQILLGMEIINTFSGLLRGTAINLHPIQNLYLHADIISSYQQTDGRASAGDIIASYPTTEIGKYINYDIFQNCQKYSKQHNITVSISDFDGDPITIIGNWNLELIFLRIDNLGKINNFIDIEALKMIK